jgi:tubulin polyglutamylase TTLL4
VVNAFKTAGFRLSDGAAWNALWTGLIRPSKLKHMNEFQKLNHFAGAWNIGHKGNLWRNVQRQRRRNGRDFELAPNTYIFPEDYKRWQNDREINNFKDMYIMKPTASSCGRGISVIDKKQQVKNRSGYLVSKYISKPHLLRGYKYDMRIYILVTSFEPLKAYFFEKGLVRLATVPYSTAKGTLKKRFIHLTNFSVNKKNVDYKKNVGNGQAPVETDEVEMSSKWSLEELRKEYTKMGINFEEVFRNIKLLCIKTLMAVEPQITTAMRATKYRS